VSTLEALLVAALSRINAEIDESFRREHDPGSTDDDQDRRDAHAYALGLGRAVRILRDFIGWL
jgi:hypothetical protein